MTLKKPVGPNGTVITMIQRNAVLAQGALPENVGQLKIDTLDEKGGPKGGFVKIQEIENGTNIDQWGQYRHQDLQNKLSPGAVSEKHKKQNEISIGK